jgi:hypothetical protein
MKRSRIKTRGGQCYQNKVNRVKAWYAHIEKTRQALNGLGVAKKELRPLEYFIDKIKKPNGERQSSSSTTIVSKKGKR